MPENSFVCSDCGQDHPGAPLSFATDYPDPYSRTGYGELRCIDTIANCRCKKRFSGRVQSHSSAAENAALASSIRPSAAST
jgi:hypothetical protein